MKREQSKKIKSDAQNPQRQVSARSRSRGGPRSAPARRGGRGGPPREAEVVEAPSRPAAQEAQPAEIMIGDYITVRELADLMGRSPIDVIKVLMNYGIMAPITQTIDFETASVVAEELGVTVVKEQPEEPEEEEPEVEAVRTLRQQILAEEDPEKLQPRPPVVTVLGHVDHGKTTLLDAIRQTKVVEGEAGGITQHIGAYQVEIGGRKITFLDTPGHEAFTAMRARGAQATDIAVLVVAADDGVMPQTREAIAHARAAQVPIVVALNKIDAPGANPDRVKSELSDEGLTVEDWGGDVICAPVSAKFREGIEDLLENILLVSDVEPPLANPEAAARGTVIEGRLDRHRGVVATLLVQNGTLHQGDTIVVGTAYGRVRAMFDDRGQALGEAGPSRPVAVLGLSEVPQAGDEFEVVRNDRAARGIVEERQEEAQQTNGHGGPRRPTSLDEIFSQMQAGKARELNLILKADVQGSLEPIINSIEKLSTDQLRVRLLHSGTGNISESDVTLAQASNAVVVGFSVDVDNAAQRKAEAEGVEIRRYKVIYELIEDVDKALQGMLEPVYEDHVVGHAEVRQVFRIPRQGMIAGCYILDGTVTRNGRLRVRRADEVVHEGRVSSLKRYQEDVTEVRSGFECGIGVDNFNGFEEGDIIEVYERRRVR